MSVQISSRVPEELNNRIETFSAENNCSKSEAIRRLIERGFENNDLKIENRQLRNQLTATNQRIDETNDVVEYVQQEQELQRAQEKRRNAPVWQRAKWWVFGRSEVEE